MKDLRVRRKPVAGSRQSSTRARAMTLAVGVLTAFVFAATASAHASMSPPVAKAKMLQQFTLSVPTEKENLTTTRIELTVPDGFSIDSFEPAPSGWRKQVQSQGSGEEAVVQKVTWTGGKVPTGEDAVFRFNATAASAKTYTFAVRQTYSDGSVVDWSGPESSDDPAPTVQARSALGGGGGSTLAIVALAVGAVGVVLGLIALVSTGRRPLA
jgi:uncharacterized protein YcnI